VRPLHTLAEFAEAVNLQRVVWGWGDLDLLPVRFFVVARNIGGQILGAFDDDVLAGFLLAIPGIDSAGRLYLHSHMLGVLAEYRNSGAGLALKLAQKQDALNRGIKLVEWSFDPLDLKNAYFNINKLGATVPRYEPNLYGITSSTLQAGLPTDRCIAHWDLSEPAKSGNASAARVSIPASIAQIKHTHPERAREIQAAVAREFQKHLSAGLVATGFERSPDAGTYLFTPWPSK
jgi:predicted GNAT superfamily acetyltransferase